MASSKTSEDASRVGYNLAHPEVGEEVVISGISGAFPDSNDVYHFRDNIHSGKNLISDGSRRRILDHPEVTTCGGELLDVTRFDAGFFGVSHVQSHTMDPQLRILLEKSIEAVMDGGVNPSELHGSNTGVFIGACYSETEIIRCHERSWPGYRAMTTCLKTTLANRVSYHLKLNGPSLVIDTACSSSVYAFEAAFRAIRSGQCESAIVGGVHLTLHPHLTLQLSRLGMLSKNGTSKVFDANGDGYIRSEAIVVIFLQKSKMARRIYGNVVHAKTNCDGFKEEGITCPSSTGQMNLFQELYHECNIDPSCLSYLEAHGTGTVVGDTQEVTAIDSVFCKSRKTPLLIGSVKSVVGHCEAASALVSIINVIIGFERGLIPLTINYTSPRPNIEALVKDRVKVVTQSTSFQDDRVLVGINNFGFGGANGHVLLSWNSKNKIHDGVPEDNLPRLVCISGRTKSATDKIFNNLKSKQLDAEHLWLHHQIYSKTIDGHMFRGYTILTKFGELVRYSARFDNLGGSLFFHFGYFTASYSSSIAKQLNVVPNFKESIEKVHKVLQNQGIDLIHLIENEVRSHFNSTIISAAIQIALISLFKSLSLIPCGVFGCGIGQIICAYYTEALTLEETFLYIIKILAGSTSVSCVQNCVSSIPKGSFVLDIGDNPHTDTSNHLCVLSFDELDDKSNYFVGLLKILGRLYQFGFNNQTDKLYPQIDGPVSRTTPMLSPYIQWSHDKNWITISKDDQKCHWHIVQVSVKESEWAHLSDHVIHGQMYFPATAYLYLIWKLLSRLNGTVLEATKIVFENCRFLRPYAISPDEVVNFTIMIKSSKFQITDNERVIVTGRAYIPSTSLGLKIPPTKKCPLKHFKAMNTRDVYKELHLRGYNYSGDYRQIIEYDYHTGNSSINWNKNWTSFMTNIIQIKILGEDSRDVRVLTGIRKLLIDPSKHANLVNREISVSNNKEANVIKGGGIEIQGLQTASLKARTHQNPVLEKYEFVPNKIRLSIAQSVRVNLQIIFENTLLNKMKVIELIDEETKTDAELISPIIQNISANTPLIKTDLVVLSKNLFTIPYITVKNEKLFIEKKCTLIIGSNLLQRNTVLETAINSTIEDGYILSRHYGTIDVKNNLKKLKIVTHHIAGNETFILLRKNKELESPTVINVSDTINFAWLSTLQQSLKNEPSIIIYVQNEPVSGILGLVNCIRREPQGRKVKCVITFGEVPALDVSHPFYKHQLDKDFAVNIYKNHEWGTYRHLLLDDNVVQSEHCFLDSLVQGDITTLRWMEGPLKISHQTEQESRMIIVYYSAVNLRDVMLASGQLNSDVSTKNRLKQQRFQGLEFSGRNSAGQRIMGIIEDGALATVLLSDPYFSFPVPDSWTLEDAATVPVAYTIVLFAFFKVVTIKTGDSILIHAGCGGIGQAAINVALSYNCDVFTTVKTAEEKEFLLKAFPQLPESHIVNYNDASFERMIYNLTNSRGVNYVLNSLREDRLVASLCCLAQNGHFLQIGQLDLFNNNELNLLLLRKEVSFHGVQLDRLFDENPIRIALQQLMLEHIRTGVVKPLYRTVYNASAVEKAFKQMEEKKHMGKILVKIRDEEESRIPTPINKTWKVIPRYSCNSENVYILIGGLGGFGLELTDWLIRRGANKIMLVNRTGITTGYQSYRINIWKSYNVEIHLSTTDITTRQGCQQLIDDAKQFGKIDAIFNLAVNLKDSVLENQTQESFKLSFGPKANATCYLDEITRKHCPQLKDFVVFSSVSCGRGIAGQTNYGMANSVMERVCENRKQDGLPALAIQWGAIGDVGILTNTLGENGKIEVNGTRQQAISSCLHVLDQLLHRDNHIVSSMVVADKKEEIGHSSSIINNICNILGISDLKSISKYAKFSELGMDSLRVTEIKQVVQDELGILLGVEKIRGLTFAKLEKMRIRDINQINKAT